MKYPEFQQIIDTMDAAGYDYKKEVANIEKRRIAVANGTKISIEEHVKAMVYSLLSDQRVWNDLVPHIPQIDGFFANYNVTAIKNTNPDELVKNITSIKCGNMKIRKQMNSLKDNIAQLEQIEQDYDGSIDDYYRSTDKVAVVKSLSEGTYKLKWMGVALVCEYLKGVGVNTIKPDSLLMRLLNRLGYSKKKMDYWEAIRICEDIAQEYNMSMPMVDTILWQYCARGKFEVCTENPKCSLCGVKNCPSRTIMFTKNEFIEELNRSLKVAQGHMKIEDKDRPNRRIANVETIEFDIEATMKEWATENNVNCAVVDISALTLDDVSAIPEILSTPTVLLLKNFGDYTHDMLREPYRQLVKDCCYGTDGIFANNFLFAVATTKSGMPIQDMSERCCFGHYN